MASRRYSEHQMRAANRNLHFLRRITDFIVFSLMTIVIHENRRTAGNG